MIFFDIETACPVGTAKNARNRWPGICYAKGWTDYQGMGIAVIGVWDAHTREYGHYLGGTVDMQRFRELIDGRMLIGFNSAKFDIPLLEAHGVYADRHWDLLQALQKEHRKRLSLSALASMNGIPGKTISGELAPIRWQQGHRREVIDYCLGDVTILLRLARLAWVGEMKALDQKGNGIKVQLRPPINPAIGSITKAESN